MTPGGILDAHMMQKYTVWGRKDLKDVEDSTPSSCQ